MDVRGKLVELLDIIIQPGQKTLGDIADYRCKYLHCCEGQCAEEGADND